MLNFRGVLDGHMEGFCIGGPFPKSMRSVAYFALKTFLSFDIHVKKFVL